MLPGQSSYESTSRHGVESNSYGDWDSSYRVALVAVTDSSKLANSTKKAQGITDDVANSRITRVPKQEEITHVAWLNHSNVSEGTDTGDKRDQIQVTLEYSVRGNERTFEDGYLLVAAYEHWDKSNRVPEITLTNRTIALSLNGEQDVVDFITLLDDLWRTPLAGDDHLKIELEPTIPGSEQSTVYIGDVMAITKSEQGYRFWSPGYKNFLGEQLERGWRSLDLFQLRETLAHCSGGQARRP